MLAAADLLTIMPRCPAAKAALYASELAKAMSAGAVDRVTRAAAFLGQIAHESGELRWMLEQADGEAYEGRKSLGNVQPGDGPRYKGRGPIQLTGRANYREASVALGVPLESSPDRAADPDVCFRVAVWYWNTRKLSDLADAGDFRGVTRGINGGMNGYDDRLRYYWRALEVLGRAAPLI